MLLAVDVGNTRIKFALFEGTALVNTACAQTAGFTSADCTRIAERLVADCSTKGCTITRTGVSSVVPQVTLELLPALKNLSATPPVVISPGMEFGMAIDIDTPHTLGPDRLSGAAAVFEHFAAAAAVVDLGTATTISVVDEKGTFIGGTIMPGIYSMLRCLNRDTALLPQMGRGAAPALNGRTPADAGGRTPIDAGGRTPIDAVAAPPGRNTESAIVSGVVFGTAGAVERIIAEMERSTGLVFKVAATGGAAPCVLPHLRRCDLHDPNLVLKGVRAICEMAHKRRHGSAT